MRWSSSIKREKVEVWRRYASNEVFRVSLKRSLPTYYIHITMRQIILQEKATRKDHPPELIFKVYRYKIHAFRLILLICTSCLSNYPSNLDELKPGFAIILTKTSIKLTRLKAAVKKTISIMEKKEKTFFRVFHLTEVSTKESDIFICSGF